MFIRCAKFLRRHPELLLILAAFPLHAATPIESWLTTADLRQKISPQTPLAFANTKDTAQDRVQIEDTTTFQTILGLGSSLEPTTCSNFWRMPVAERETLMERVVNSERGIGMNLMHLCIGTSDFTGDPWYSYCDLPPAETDTELKRFSIDRDRGYILPVIQLARRKNPNFRPPDIPLVFHCVGCVA